jgi:hypothetical protein
MALIITTVLSLIVAAVMSVVAWRLARDERRRSEARVATLAADIHGEGPSPVHVSDRFFEEGQSRTPGNPLRALAIGILVVGSVIALVIFASGPRGSSVAAAPTVAEAPAAAPLELVALGHERDGDRLIVRGVVRYSNRSDLADLTAVVSVFNHEGDIAASGQALVAGTAPAPTRGAAGVQSTFIVTVPGVHDVSRYRVAFKSNDRIIAHLDRRDHGVTAEVP